MELHAVFFVTAKTLQKNAIDDKNATRNAHLSYVVRLRIRAECGTYTVAAPCDTCFSCDAHVKPDTQWIRTCIQSNLYTQSKMPPWWCSRVHKQQNISEGSISHTSGLSPRPRACRRSRRRNIDTLNFGILYYYCCYVPVGWT